MRDISSDRLQALKDFFGAYPAVAAVYLFGSYGTEHEHPGSDLDIGVVFRIIRTILWKILSL